MRHRGIVYLIETERDGVRYYVNRVDEKTRAVIWTPNRNKAISFHTENGVHYFIHSHLPSRKNILVVKSWSEHA
jgi:hypothetical protein